MTTQMIEITQTLRSLGVPPSVLKTVRESVSHAQAPDIDATVIGRLREEVSAHKRAILVLGKNGGYSVFSPEGHAALRASARKNQPWKMASKKRSKVTKH